MKTTKTPWFVGNGVRHTDTVGICTSWKDGEEEGEETIAEVLPGARGIARNDAKLICRAVNQFEPLKALQNTADQIEADCGRTMDYATIGNLLRTALVAVRKAENEPR